MNNPYKAYQKTQITTASREKVLLMLYEGAIRFVKHAEVAMLDKKIAEKGKQISKATAIISELMATLDFKVGGQLAVDLENLYVFMIDKLIEGNINNDVECLRTVEQLLRTLHVAWQDVVENPRPDGVPSPKLQPEEYKKWVETNGSASVKSGAKQDVSAGNHQQKLKHIA
ncbi:MAG TPA: flagellar export chaperone FliS [Oligoflexus sp.]|uniref:flagellar export chaperone FliS n=1 Tax=Oligoflexus sp. TaxID=1971216 RepID=UPI002D5E40B8|nr:flagellar export chaperone FliS [Oligoflexus sp.]HYX39875.1 flagellar export chaperone FliS [Oligoflexus sp.]